MLQAFLPDGFVRTHRTHIVDLARVRSLRNAPGGRLEVLLADGQAVPVGRLYRQAVRSRLLPAGAS